MGSAFEYIKVNNGLMLSEDYSLGEVQYPCKFNSSKEAVQLQDYVFLPSGDEELLKDAVAALGPIAVGMDGSQNNFFTYEGGIYLDESCTYNLNHAVLIGDINNSETEFA